MNQIPDDDLDHRLAVQIERAKLRHVEFMEETDRWHQQQKVLTNQRADRADVVMGDTTDG
jgi:hypothetical protein